MYILTYNIVRIYTLALSVGVVSVYFASVSCCVGLYTRTHARPAGRLCRHRVLFVGLALHGSTGILINGASIAARQESMSADDSLCVSTTGANLSTVYYMRPYRIHTIPPYPQPRRPIRAR